jgi:hypothetical protein
MTQLSRPYQIALVTLALLVLVWFAALHGRKPSSGGGSGSSPAASSAPAAPATSSAAAEAKAAAAPTHVYHGAAPGVEGLTRAIDKAHGAVAQSQQEAHRVESSEPSASSAATTPAGHATATASAPAHPAAVKPAHVHATPPAVKHPATKASMQAAVEHELQQGKTVLILFWNRHGSDDVAVHSALPAVQHALGRKVAVH